MKITVVTVCRNVLADLQKTYQSVSEQSYDDIEYIVIDGASTDGTPGFISEHLRGSSQFGIDKYLSEPDAGIYDAMNKGVRMATGEWIIFMNAGDLFFSGEVLSRLAADAEGVSDNVAVVYGDVVKKDKEGLDYIKKSESPHASHRMIFCHQSAIARRSLLLKYPFDTRHKMSADFKFFKTLLKEKYEFKQVDYPVSRFDVEGISNRRRSAGLADNISVIKEVDGVIGGLRHLMRIYPTYLISKLRGR